MTRSIFTQFPGSTFYRSGKSSLAILEEDMNTIFSSMLMSNYDPWNEEFNEQLHFLVSSGIYNFIRSFYDLEDQIPPQSEEIPPMVLTLDHLGIGFEVCGIVCLLSIFIFLLELLIFMLRTHKTAA